jgi:methionine-rich copper-binding protein CopC
MNAFRSRALLALGMLAALTLMAACSTSSNNSGDVNPIETGGAPVVTAHFPADSATGVSRSGPYWIRFSKAMNHGMVEAAISLTPGDISLSPYWSGDTLYLTPSTQLDAGTMYAITASEECASADGHSMGTAHTSCFTTTAAADVTPPTVVSTSPANNATDVNGVDQVEITFSESMNDYQTQGAIVVVPTPVDHYFEWRGTTLVFNHSAFPQDSLVAIYVTTAALDLAGNHIASMYSFSFRTRHDATRPRLVSAAPADGATNVSAALDTITLNFSEPMDQLSFQMPPENVDARINQLTGGSEPTFNDDYSTIKVPVQRPVLPGCTYWATFLNVKDGGGNFIDPNPTLYDFTTAGTASYFPAKSDAMWSLLGSGPRNVARTITNYVSGTGRFDESFIEDGGAVDGVTYFKKTSTEIQHLGRSNYDHGQFQFTMMWSQPLTYIKLPLSSHLGDSWNISATATPDASTSIALSGHIEIEPSTVDLVSPAMHGTFKGCYVHHLYADLTISQGGNPVDVQHVHQIMWLAPGVGPVMIVDSNEGAIPDTMRVVDWTGLY